MKVITIPAILILLLTGGLSNDEVTALRERGQAAVDELHAKGDNDALLDRVCAQKDCRASRLFWYTDLDEAKAEARRSGRSIIALHMLGRLDEELSCANSRFFRTILYSDPAISALLRDKFVLYWHSVRPVPQITIDFGDGRTIHQTITGNSAHFLLDADGRPLDVLPGLYAPNEFAEHVERWTKLDRRSLGDYHTLRLAAVRARWRDLNLPEFPDRPRGQATAAKAMTVAVTKSMPEVPLMAQLDIGTRLRMVRAQEWEYVGVRERPKVKLSPEAVELILQKHFGVRESTPSDRRWLIEELRRTVGTDTVFNECMLHGDIHQWFLDGEVTTLEALSARIYDELFFTPSNDPWMGLKQPSVFTAIAE